MQNKIEINIEVTSVSYGNQARQVILRSLACRDRALLILATEITGIEHAVAVAACGGATLRFRSRQLNRRKTGLPQGQNVLATKSSSQGAPAPSTGAGTVTWLPCGSKKRPQAMSATPTFCSLKEIPIDD